jgi:hypothetical protein
LRIRVQKRGLVPAAVVAVVGTVVLYLASTVGLAAWHRQDDAAVTAGRGYVPMIIENAPPTVPTTGEYGPPGPVALVYAGTDVGQGLSGSVERPWLTVSATTGEYRALTEPGLPQAGAGVMQVSPDGTRLAWTGPEGLVVYDTLTGDVTRTGIDGVDVVGPFSPDGAHLLVHAGAAQVVDLAAGEVVAEGEADPGAVQGAAWRPDGSAVDLVTQQGMVTVSTDGSSDTAATSIPAEAELAWSPTGDRLADLREVDGNFRLFLSGLRGDGSLAAPRQVDVPNVALQRLFGFSGEQTVTVDAYLLETGSVERVLDVSLAQGTTNDLTTLPSPGRNWVDITTLSVATDTLAHGNYEWPTQLWPWSYTSRLAACALFMFFLFGLYVTRRPKDR